MSARKVKKFPTFYGTSLPCLQDSSTRIEQAVAVAVSCEYLMSLREAHKRRRIS